MSLEISPKRKGLPWPAVIIAVETAILFTIFLNTLLDSVCCVLTVGPPLLYLEHIDEELTKAKIDHRSLSKTRVEELIAPFNKKPRGLYRFTLLGTDDNWLLICAPSSSFAYRIFLETPKIRPRMSFLIRSSENGIIEISPSGVEVSKLENGRTKW